MLHIEICGDDTLSVVVRKRDKRRAIAAALRQSGEWLECVEGRESVVVQFDVLSIKPDAARKRLRKAIWVVHGHGGQASDLIEIPVCYGGEYGPELAPISEMLGISADEIIRTHAAADYTVDMLGFTPGFAYVDGLPDTLSVPRLTEPRQHVPAGSVGIAGGQTGLYALPGPGGWPLIGRTPVALFRRNDSAPFLLRAGIRVRFAAIDEADFRRMLAE